MGNILEGNGRMTTLDEISEKVHKTAVEHGWWEDTPERPLRTFGDVIALIHSEVSEALEEFRDGHLPAEIYYRHNHSAEGEPSDWIEPIGECENCVPKPEGVPIEFADVIIRLADAAARYGFSLDEAVAIKMKFNDTRDKYHGGKAI